MAKSSLGDSREFKFFLHDDSKPALTDAEQVQIKRKAEDLGIPAEGPIEMVAAIANWFGSIPEQISKFTGDVAKQAGDFSYNLQKNTADAFKTTGEFFTGPNFMLLLVGVAVVGAVILFRK